jgi:DNA repair exonuclease SbcCD nuclease subunit
MKLFHTSDWHLGRALDDRKRYDECEAFLNWLAALIESQDIDALLVAGDVFDSSTPSNRAQELYYRFLCRVAASGGARCAGALHVAQCAALPAARRCARPIWNQGGSSADTGATGGASLA